MSRYNGSKVSEIANRFQPKSYQMEEIIAPSRSRPKYTHHTISNQHHNMPTSTTETETPGIVIRSESHVTRFNNARALFEKLGEENNRSHKITPLQTTKSASNIMDARSRSSSANSEPPLQDSKSLSRSPSPPLTLKKLEKMENELDNDRKLKVTNGGKILNVNKSISEDNRVKTNGNVTLSENIPPKPVLAKKPEKPERTSRLNSKELIEKQRNWTSHFSKSRSNRYTSEPKAEIKTNQNGTTREENRATRSSSFNNKILSPTTSPPPPPVRTEASRRSNFLRKDRPNSVIPTYQETQKSPLSSPTKDSNIPSSFFNKESKNDGFSENPTLPKPVQSLSHSNFVSARSQSEPTNDKSNDYIFKNNAYVESISNCGLKPLPLNNHRNEVVKSKSVDEQEINREMNKENVSVTSVCSLSPLGSPSKMCKSENEKQEQEDDEKSFFNFTDNSAEITKRESENDFLSRCKKPPPIPSSNHNRRPSIVSSSTTSADEGGFNEPTPKVEARLKPHEESLYDLPMEDEKHIQYSDYADIDEIEGYGSDGSGYKEVVRSEPSPPVVKTACRLTKEQIEALYAVPHKPNSTAVQQQKSTTSTDSENSQATVIPQQKSVDSDTLYSTEVSTPVSNADLNEDCNVEIKDCDTSGSIVKSEPFILTREVLQNSHSSTATAELPAEANILDLNDVEYADASDNDNSFSDKCVPEPEAMTPTEADNLLSQNILEKKIRTEILSDEEAQEVTRMLNKAINKTNNKWQSDSMNSVMQDSINVSSFTESSLNDSMEPSSLQDESITDSAEQVHNYINWNLNKEAPEIAKVKEVDTHLYDSTSSIETSAHDEGFCQSKFDVDASASDSGLIDSVTSLSEGNNLDEINGFTPKPVAIIGVEHGVHYYEDGHFWMEVPGLPQEDEDDDELECSGVIPKQTKVVFSSKPMKVYSTFSISDYDRRNEDVDPVAASAEYELEKRVEKMDVFPVELVKGPEGLGLSIIGMGVGADAGLEKLGIFVKTITTNGAASKDSRIRVNDQIIEVDGKSLVGVTQAYAASVLRNTSGLVKFLIGREKDPENSEVAQLIKQSLQADKEREERRQRILEAEQQSEASTVPVSGSANTSVSDGPTSPTVIAENLFENEHDSRDVDTLKQLLLETQQKYSISELEVSRLKAKLMEQNGIKIDDSEKLQQANQKLKEAEKNLLAAKKEAQTYQDMLEQSQSQFLVLEKKYSKAKHLVREFQQRELDMMHREEFYQQLLQEKDVEYNSLVKNLKDRIIILEKDLLDTKEKAGLPLLLPYDSSNSKQLTPQMSRKQPPKPMYRSLEPDFSDTEISDVSPEDDKTATVERKLPIKDEFDSAVPPHELLDISASKSKAELANRGALANRQLPTGKKGSLSNSSSDYGLDESYNSGDELVDSAFSQSDSSITTKERRSRPNALNTSLYSQYSAQQLRSNNMQYSQYSQMQNSSYYSSQMPNNPNLLYAKVQKESVHMQGSPDPWSGGSNKVGGIGVGPPTSLAEQLKQVLADRERRSTGDSLSSSTDELNERDRHDPAHHLLEEIRQAVNEANAKVKKVVPVTLSPPGSTPWQHQGSTSPTPPSPSSLSSGSVSPSRHDSSWPTTDLSLSSLSICSEKRPSQYFQNAPISEWTKEQVCQWLIDNGFEHHIAKFIELQVNGASLLLLTSTDFKILGITSDDKNRLKRKIKELKVTAQKEKKQMEKDRKEKEKLQRKAEKANKKK